MSAGAERTPLLSHMPSRLVVHAPWLYPFIGIFYFVTHPFLWPLLRARLLPCALLSLAVLVTLIAFTYLPQVAFLAIFQGRLAWFNGAFLVLGEGAVIIALLFEAFFVDETLVDVFDAVLIQKGCIDLVSPARRIIDDGTTSVKKLGRPYNSTQYSPFSLRLVCDFLLFLPINLIPLVGVPVFLAITGRRAGPFQHWRYFELLGLSKKKRRKFVTAHRWQYTGFGTVTLALQLMPLLSMLFLITTAVGAALWAVQLEHERQPSDFESGQDAVDANQMPATDHSESTHTQEG